MSYSLRHTSEMAGSGAQRAKRPKQRFRSATVTSPVRGSRRPQTVDAGELAAELAQAAHLHVVEVTPTTYLLVLPDAPAQKAQNALAAALARKKTLKLSPEQQDRLYSLLQEAIGAQPQSKADVAASVARALTPRQMQIARMVSLGAPNKLIARSLGLSVGTVKVHLHRIYRLLGIASRVELAIFTSGK